MRERFCIGRSISKRLKIFKKDKETLTLANISIAHDCSEKLSLIEKRNYVRKTIDRMEDLCYNICVHIKQKGMMRLIAKEKTH